MFTLLSNLLGAGREHEIGRVVVFGRRHI